MPHLTLVGTSDDRTHLLLVDDRGVEHTLAVDGRLRAALRGETSRLGQLEITMDSALRPRDIQARIRAGDTPEAVAEAAQTTVDKIMAFAGPVIAERQHVAERAQRSSVRRRGAEGTQAARTLGDAVAAHLRAQQVDPDSVEWDAWRREDGRWALTGTYRTTRREGVASFTYDAPGSYVTLDDDDARWLVGEVVEAPQRPAPARGDDLSAARARRAAGGQGAAYAAEDELPLGDDAIELVTGAVPGADDDTASTPAVTEPVVDPVAEPAEPAEPAAPGEQAAAAGDGSGDQPEDETPADVPVDEEPPRRPVTKKRGRASVPSWDEIMFGGRDQ